MIQIEELKKSFGSFRVLDGVSFQVPPGQVTGLLGPNGCGKTTLIKSILGLVIPDSGEIKIDGESILGSWQYRKRLGYMPQNPEYPGNLSLQELISLLEDVREEKASRFQELVDRFDLQSYVNRPFSVLSGGTKQKVAVVTAFAFAPQILILDEPTVGLDPLSALRFKQLVKEVTREGRSVLLVSHIMGEMEQLTDELVFLLDGKLHFSGSLAEIRQKVGMPQATLEEAVVQVAQGGSL